MGEVLCNNHPQLLFLFIERNGNCQVGVDGTGRGEQIHLQIDCNETENSVKIARIGLVGLPARAERERDVVEQVSFSEMFCSVYGVVKETMADSDQDASIEKQGVYSISDEMRDLVEVSTALQRFGWLDADDLRKLLICQVKLMAQKLVQLKRKIIPGHSKTATNQNPRALSISVLSLYAFKIDQPIGRLITQGYCIS